MDMTPGDELAEIAQSASSKADFEEGKVIDK